jgi:hypothetical protein
LADAERENAVMQAVREIGGEIEKAMNQENEIFSSLRTLFADRNNKHSADGASIGTQ